MNSDSILEHCLQDVEQDLYIECVCERLEGVSSHSEIGIVAQH